MNYVCGDNRFEIIERYKNKLISATNIESSPEEMAVLDNILFRFWQMGWLKEQGEQKFFVDESGNITPLPVVVRCKDCKKRDSWECWQYFFGRIKIPDDWYCADGERKSD